MLFDSHRSEIEAILAKYPAEHKRSAVMPLLFLAQREYGSVTPEALEEVAAIVGISSTQVGSLVGFYSLFYEQPGGRYRIQICTDLPCALRGAEAFAQALCERLGVRLGETTPDGLFTVEAVMCLAACDRAPMFQLQDRDGLRYYENQTVDSAMTLIDMLRQGVAHA